MRSALHDVLVCQRRLGLTTIEVCAGGYLRLRPNTWSTHIFFWLLQGSLLLATFHYIRYWNFSFEPTHTGVANHYAHVTEVMEPLTIIVLIGWLRLHQQSLLQLLNHLHGLLEMEQRGEKATSNWMYIVLLSSNFVTFSACALYMAAVDGYELKNAVPLYTFSMRQLYFSCLVHIFLVTVHQIEELLDAQLRRVENSLRNGDLRELSKRLYLIDSIFRICELEMNVIFSVPFCLHFTYIVLETASISYIFALVQNVFMVGMCVFIILPLVVYAALPTVGNQRLDNVVSNKVHSVECVENR